ncbi:hypothetical protein LJC12_06155 [Odoribacter sp. OttesenSCG-928-J03]|nr:hypothetical protein [Odoribacter sp. OttesenSCG-928-J03]MDL2283167.1 hypothetical protein [Odoribacter sp. OttesenSCG-928-G04]
MKKIIYSLGLLIALWGCDSNDIKELGRSDSNVYFPQSKTKIVAGEQAISIPLNVANVQGGKAVDVRIRIVDSTAQEGINFNVISGLDYHFSKGWGTEYIVIEAPETEEDELKRVFKIEIESATTELANTNNSMLVEVMNYSSHPLRKLLGSRRLIGRELMQESEKGDGAVEFPVSIYPDENEGLTIYLSGMTGGTFGGTLPDIQLTVDTLRHRIVFPHQTFSNQKLGSVTGDVESFRAYITSNNQVMIETDPKDGKMDCELIYDTDGNIFFKDWVGMWWTSGMYQEYPIYLFYGYFANQYFTVITK